MTKITTSPEYKTFVSSAKTADDAKNITALTAKLSDAGTLLGQGKTDAACAEYQSVEDQLKIK